MPRTRSVSEIEDDLWRINLAIADAVETATSLEEMVDTARLIGLKADLITELLDRNGRGVS